MKHSDFIRSNYEKHEHVFDEYATGKSKEKKAKSWFRSDTIDAWRHERMYSQILPLLHSYPGSSWLTVGDGRFGKDARFIQNHGSSALATDISDTLLKEAKFKGYIKDYKKENAEALSFADESFDFVFCKESYHHFPRPMVALYEMLRVAKKGVILIEPNDNYVFSSIRQCSFLSFKNLIKKIMRRKIIKDNFEIAGNFVYRISEREIEKVALGVNIPAVAFKGMNDNYFENIEFETSASAPHTWRKIKRHISISNFLCEYKIKAWSILIAIIFKEEPDATCQKRLHDNRFSYIRLPKNPYVKNCKT